MDKDLIGSGLRSALGLCSFVAGITAGLPPYSGSKGHLRPMWTTQKTGRGYVPPATGSRSASSGLRSGFSGLRSSPSAESQYWRGFWGGSLLSTFFLPCSLPAWPVDEWQSIGESVRANDDANLRAGSRSGAEGLHQASGGGLALSMSFRSHQMPCASTFAHWAAVSRIERCSSFSSGGVGGRPLGRFSCSMRSIIEHLSNHEKALAKRHLLNHNKEPSTR